MPRGYLKHNRGVSKKKARGGASRHWTNVNNEGTLITRRNDIKTLDEVFDDIVLAPSTYTAKRNTTTCLEDHGTSTTKYPIRECAICFNKRPTITLSKKCWHHAACKECLLSFMYTIHGVPTRSSASIHVVINLFTQLS